MDEYARMVKQQRKWMLYLLAIFLIGSMFTPYTSVFSGLLIGTVLSFLGMLLLQRNIDKLGRTVEEKKKYRGGLGTFTRMAFAALAVFLAVRFEESINLLAVIIGLMSSYFVLGIGMLTAIIADRKNSES